MIVNTDIPYITKDGIEYLIRFTLFDKKHLSEEIDLPIVDIVIETNANFEDINNSASSLFQIAQIICNYAMIHDAVYYCYCSDKPIRRSENKYHLTHQEYRSMLFCKMFEKNNNIEFFNKIVIIEDSSQGNHYVHLMSKLKNEKLVEIISEKLSLFDK